MKQMTIGEEVPVVKRMKFDRLSCGFFTKDYDNKVFFAMIHGKWTFTFPVREDGTISKKSDDFPWPNQKVKVINPQDLGITEIKWV